MPILLEELIILIVVVLKRNSLSKKDLGGRYGRQTSLF